MKINFNGLTRVLSTIGRALKNAAPEIAIVSGTVGLVAAGVVACKETPKAMKIVEEHKEKIAITEKAAEDGVTMAGETYTAEDEKHDKAIIFCQDATQLIKTYAPAIIIATLSVITIFAGGKIFRKRLTAITGAYAMLESNFSKYRKAVVEKFGKETDQELRYGVRKEVIEEKTIDEDGNEKTELKEVKTTDYDGHSDYARLFDEYNPNWKKNANWNMTWLLAQQQWANDRLRERKYVFLNEIYQDLEVDESEEGQLVGWVYDPSHPESNFISFGLEPIIKDKNMLEDVMNDHERSFLLDFNVRGFILDKVYPNRKRDNKNIRITKNGDNVKILY